MKLERSVRKYALKNAVEYGGACNPSAVIGKVINETRAEPDKTGKVAGRICSEVNKMTMEEQKEELEKYEFEEEEEKHDPLPDLENAEEGEVVFRFAPNPNGAPHIGHARGMVINGELKEKYDGKLILRFDDTDPVTKRPLKQAYEMLEEDYRWLGYEIDEVRRCSENFDRYIQYAEKLLEKEKAYVCECSQEEGQKYRKEGEECPCRKDSSESNMELWKEMKNGGLNEGEATLKIKTDMDHKNPAVRDFVAFRIIEEPDHPVTGNEYRVWPMLDFQGAIEDHLMGTTHIVRGKELRASTKRQKYIYKYFGWDYPHVRYWGNVQISGFNAPVSTSSLAEMIEEGEIDGWDDPRAPTLRALKKRGFRPEAIKEFFIDMGVSERDIEASVETLESENRDLVEESDRCFFVRKPYEELEIEDLPDDLEIDLPLHPDDTERGSRDIELQVEDGKATFLIEKDDLSDGLLRLKGLCNVEIEGNKAQYVDGDHRKAIEENASIIHWLPETSEEASLVRPDGKKTRGRIEREIEDDEVVQFVRVGFVRKDESGEFYFGHE